jgi:hypothetical protein
VLSFVTTSGASIVIRRDLADEFAEILGSGHAGRIARFRPQGKGSR